MTEGILDPFERAIAEFEELTIYAEPAALEDTQPAEGTRSEPPVTECDHLDGGEIPHDTEGIVVWLYFTYCPKCGEKL